MSKKAEMYVTTVQDRQMAACRSMYADEPIIPLSIRHEDDVECPIEDSRFYGPFTAEVLVWVRQMVKLNIAHRIGYDADGREYLQY